MPCSGIAVLKAQVPANLVEQLQTREQQDAFRDFLKQAGVSERLLSGLFLQRPGLVQYTLGSLTLTFDRARISLSGNRGLIARDDVAQLFSAAQSYAALINQQQILTALTQMGFTPQEFSYDSAGALSFAISLEGV